MKTIDENLYNDKLAWVEAALDQIELGCIQVQQDCKDIAAEQCKGVS